MSQPPTPTVGEVDEGYYPELDELPPRPRRKLLTPVTIVLLLVLWAAGGFIGGVLVQKGQQSGGSSVSGTGFAARFAARGGGATGGSGASGAAGSRFGSLFGGGGSGATIGTVSSIDGKTLYVTETSGNTVAVLTTSSSKITKSESVHSGSIRPGDSVVVEGIAGSKGKITASSVSDSGAGGTSGSGGLASLFGSGSASTGATSSSSTSGVSSLFGSSG
jgi:hypothetical protein